MDKSVMIVDDNETITESLGKILESEGYLVEKCHTGKEAIEKYRSRHFHLALLDIRLPDMEGTDLLKALNNGDKLYHSNLQKTIKIMITGHATLENAIESLNGGASAYLLKPVGVKKLLDTIKSKETIPEGTSADNSVEEKAEDVPDLSSGDSLGSTIEEALALVSED